MTEDTSHGQDAADQSSPLVSRHRDIVERFLHTYLTKPSIRLQMIRVMAKDLGPQPLGFIEQLYDDSLALLIGPTELMKFSEFSVSRVKNNAPALKMLVQYARELGRDYFGVPADDPLPGSAIPSEGAVDAFMRHFTNRINS